MKYFISFLLLFSLHNIQSQKPIRVKDFGKNPGNLGMYLYSPSNLNTNSNTPLVVVMHGCLQSAGVVAKQTGWNELADKYGFRVLYPQQRMSNNPAMCFCWYKNNDIEKNQGEDFSVKQMIDYVKANNQIDSSKVFITGLSAGAAMSVALMATYPATFNAGAIFAGAPYKVATNFWTALMAFYGWRIKSPEKWGALVREQNRDYVGKYPRMIIYQGKMDVVVNQRNGNQLMKQWTNLQGISTIPTVTIKHFAQCKAVEKNIYRTNDSSDAVIYYKVKRLGHALLVDPGKCETQGGKMTLFSADKNYFSTYWTAVDFGLIHPAEIKGKNILQKNEKGIVYSVPQNAGSTYHWKIAKGARIISGNGTNSITVDWGERGGNIDVLEQNEKCKNRYATFYVKVSK